VLGQRADGPAGGVDGRLRGGERDTRAQLSGPQPFGDLYVGVTQRRVRGLFPHTSAGELKLLPSRRANPHGTKVIDSIGEGHRARVNSLPDFLVPTKVEGNGQPVTRMLPFDKSRIFPWACRHCYAQRHADAGVGLRTRPISGAVDRPPGRCGAASRADG
jgi:hypothetical protein